jgi:hypothetical protein
MEKHPSSLGRIWYFLWESNSAWSYLAVFILAFVIIKFVFFPILSMTFATSLPMVIVESKSMVHMGDFDNWWGNYGTWYEQNGISKQDFQKWGFLNGMNKGDIIIVKGNSNGIYEKGDVIIFSVPVQTTPIIHRVVSTGDYYSTKGDNNQYQLSQEKVIQKNQVIGKAIGRIPLLGWIKLAVFNPFSVFNN